MPLHLQPRSPEAALFLTKGDLSPFEQPEGANALLHRGAVAAPFPDVPDDLMDDPDDSMYDPEDPMYDPAPPWEGADPLYEPATVLKKPDHLGWDTAFEDDDDPQTLEEDPDEDDQDPPASLIEMDPLLTQGFWPRVDTLPTPAPMPVTGSFSVDNTWEQVLKTPRTTEGLLGVSCAGGLTAFMTLWSKLDPVTRSDAVGLMVRRWVFFDRQEATLTQIDPRRVPIPVRENGLYAVLFGLGRHSRVRFFDTVAASVGYELTHYRAVTQDILTLLSTYAHPDKERVGKEVLWGLTSGAGTWERSR
jgi:hypothetical protein